MAGGEASGMLLAELTDSHFGDWKRTISRFHGKRWQSSLVDLARTSRLYTPFLAATGVIYCSHTALGQARIQELDPLVCRSLIAISLGWCQAVMLIDGGAVYLD